MLDRRRQREQTATGIAPPKKKVRFVSEEKLVKIQHFLVDENERREYSCTWQTFGPVLTQSSVYCVGAALID